MSQQQQPQGQGITDNQLFQQFTKSNQICTNSFQLLFDTATKLQQQNDLLMQLLKANDIKIPTQPLPAGTKIVNQAKPNRQQRRKMDRDAEKLAKKQK